MLEQKSRTVPELRRDLEQLGMQMVEAPTDYAMSQRFMDALKPEIAGGVAMRGLTLEKSVFNEIVQKAIDIEEALYYKNKDDCYKTKTASSLSKQSAIKSYKAKAGTSKVPLKMSGSYKKPSSSTMKDISAQTVLKRLRELQILNPLRRLCPSLKTEQRRFLQRENMPLLLKTKKTWIVEKLSL